MCKWICHGSHGSHEYYICDKKLLGGMAYRVIIRYF